jgi:hypothetical protein
MYVDAAEIDAWIDSIGTDHELPATPCPATLIAGCVPRTLTYAPVARDDLRAIRSWLTQAGSGMAARRRLRGYPDRDQPATRASLPLSGWRTSRASESALALAVTERSTRYALTPAEMTRLVTYGVAGVRSWSSAVPKPSLTHGTREAQSAGAGTLLGAKVARR